MHSCCASVRKTFCNVFLDQLEVSTNTAIQDSEQSLLRLLYHIHNSALLSYHRLAWESSPLWGQAEEQSRQIGLLIGLQSRHMYIKIKINHYINGCHRKYKNDYLLWNETSDSPQLHMFLALWRNCLSSLLSDITKQICLNFHFILLFIAVPEIQCMIKGEKTGTNGFIPWLSLATSPRSDNNDP